MSSLRELAGIHVQQRITNDSNKPWNIQVVMANGGHKMLYQEQMIAHILDYARRDPSVVAVVGMSRDTAGTEKSVRRLKKAGLVPVSTANSDNDLAARHLNYFSLAATNKEEADRLAKTVEKAEPELLGNGTKALVLASPREDPYHEQQAAAAQHALKNLNPETLSLDDGEMVQPENARVTDAVCTLQPTVIYLAGRSTDLPGLAAILDEKEECYKKKGARVAVLAGDDMTKSQAVDGLAELPEYATLYYAAFASPNSIEASQLPRNTRKVFRIRQATSPSGPFFADGSMALGYDAADVVYEAAAESGAFTRPMMSGALRGVRLTSSASGVVDFCVPPGNNQTNHSLVIFKVAGRGHPRAGQPHLVHPPETPETQTAVSPCAPRQG